VSFRQACVSCKFLASQAAGREQFERNSGAVFAQSPAIS
jgi:hypothetical protein